MNFLDQVLTSPTSTANCLKWIIEHVKQLNLDNAIHTLQRIENKRSKTTDMINIFPQEDTDFNAMESVYFGNYMIEKVIIYAQGSKTIHLNGLFDKNKQIRVGALYNHFSDVFKMPARSELELLPTLMIPIFAEQMALQQGPVQNIQRFYHIFATNKDINAAYKNKFGMKLTSIVLMYMGVFAYVYYKKNPKAKDITYNFTPKELIQYFSTIPGLTRNDITLFLEMVSCTRERYKKEYFSFRSKKDGSAYAYAAQESFDRSLPRISYRFPFLNNEDGTYSLISLVSLNESMKMERVYRLLTEVSKSFKGSYMGPAIEKYARALVNTYSKGIPHLNPKDGGDEQYGSRANRKHQPDAILETDEYILLIECKANAFNLDLYKHLSKKDIKKFVDGVGTSLKNINEYLSFHSDRLKSKTVLSVLVYYEGHAHMY
ncbi:MAG: hypothetical protein COB67_02470 [SAR324 cluster bacterium]|uniref:Uncharacterized protein n=1 Tax=SAR324 cluster bacterium TaxID=2024889 RepID=A0A2A4TA22_9DELT|nr:MAG: hypothetical protein COB67_02470 [SAR324 cluster bacterium]